MVFVLRHPVARLVSWYRYALQNARIGRDVPFADFLEMQHAGSDFAAKPQHRLVLAQGLYSRFLRPYFDFFGPDGVLVLFFEDLSAGAEGTIRKICRFAGIDPAFRPAWPLVQRNASGPVRSPAVHALYRRVREGVTARTHLSPRTQRFLRLLRTGFEPLYLRANRAPVSSTPEIPDEIFERLVDYYRADEPELERLLGVRPPWWD
jgi:hypothetical protein